MLTISRVIRSAAATALLMSAGLAEAAEQTQFDLICSGTKTDTKDRQQSPWNVRLNVDLESGQFCFHGCKDISKIERIEPGWIYLIDRSSSGGSTKLLVSRADGSISEIALHRSVPILYTGKGTCTVAPFTPFPPKLF